MDSINKIDNFLTIDVEDYFHVHALSEAIRPARWESFECRVEKNTHWILDLLDKTGSQSAALNHDCTSHTNRRATFFILGWVAERYPLLVKEIHSRGHEVASHGYGHQVIYHQKPEEFQKDVATSKKILEDLTGSEIMGYRAPTYSITENSLWALNILADAGYKYDSSIFPIKHDYYGIPSAPRFPFIWNLNGDKPEILLNHESEAEKQGLRFLREFPVSTVKLFNYNFPCSGGGYFRLLPYFITRNSLRHINKEKEPFMFYLHPWELDPDIPVIKKISPVSRFRTYVNLSRTKPRFERLLREFSFSPLSAFLTP